MMGMSLRLQLNCIVCEHPHDDKAVEVALFGAVPFALCPRCHMKASDPFDVAYRRRAREFLAGERPPEREGFKLYARRQAGGCVWIYREVSVQ